LNFASTALDMDLLNELKSIDIAALISLLLNCINSIQ
jgi:hypothetical protein